VVSYEFPSGVNRGFEVLLASRASGHSTLFLLDSHHGLKEVVGRDWISIGQGSTMLDSVVGRYAAMSTGNDLAQANSDEVSRDFAFGLCLWLTTHTQSFERSELERVGIGGIFHFIFQTTDAEYLQGDALYLIFDPDRSGQAIYFWMYRAAFVDDGLALEYLTPPAQDPDFPQGRRQTSFLYDEAFGGSLASGTPEDTDALKAKLWAELNDQPFYYCLGWMPAKPDERRQFGLHFSGGREFWVTKDGTIDSRLQDRILRIVNETP
jgi:hypothetical protein